uniref:Translocon-associated protein subunit delta n=1 Tax=Oncorhynchus tshawytscha TaxID=74940 RepID=A0AAZ3PYP5_ONCTS
MMTRIAAFLALVCLCTGESCSDPVITPSAYTTSDAVISSESVFIVELSLACANGAQSVALYADVNGRQFPVTRGQDVGKYQVSWSMPHKQASSGTYQVKFFDEESYSSLRKICALTQSCIGALWTIPSTSWLGFCFDMHCQLWDPIDRCVPFQIMSNQLNLSQVDSNPGVERMINGNRLHLSSISSQFLAKGPEEQRGCRIHPAPFLCQCRSQGSVERPVGAY